MLKRRFPHGPIFRYGLLLAEILTACNAYSFQTYSVGQVLTAAQMNQEEINIRDHVHGTSGVVALTGAQGSSLVWLATQTASASATIDFTANSSGPGFDDTYDRYIIEFDNVKPATNDVYLAMRIGTGATPTWQSGSASYLWGIVNTTPTGVGTGDGSNTIGTLIGMGVTGVGLGVGNAAGAHISGFVEYTNPEVSSDFCVFNYRNSGVRSDSKNFSHSGGGYWGTVGAITGIRFLFSAGNIASGTFRLYGVRKS